MRTVLFIALVLAACGKASSKQPPGACVAGWRATRTEWIGPIHNEVTIECSEGKPTLTYVVNEPRGSTTPISHDLSRETWDTLWKHLDMAGWRELAAPCPDTGAALEDQDITQLDLWITDGKATKKLACEASKLTSQHEAIIEAFDEAFGAAVGI